MAVDHQRVYDRNHTRISDLSHPVRFSYCAEKAGEPIDTCLTFVEYRNTVSPLDGLAKAQPAVLPRRRDPDTLLPHEDL